MDYMKINSPEEAAVDIKTISDETCEGSELQMLINDIESLINELDEVWQSNAALKTKEELTESLENLRALQAVLNADGAVAAADLNDIIESQR